MKQLKAISKALLYRSTAYQTFIYTPPRSGAKKAEWIYAIGAFFHAHGSNNAVYDALNDTPDDMLPAAESTTPTNVATNTRPSSNASRTANACQSSEVSTVSSSAGMVAANSLQFGSNQILGGHQSTLGVATTGVVAASINVNETINSDTGLIRPAIHVKRESPPLQSDANASTTTTYSSAEIDELPRDYREMTMVASLRNMGFTCTREILTALRVVASNREEIYGVGNGWNVDEQVDAAMMWIVTEREEAAEAAILDAARLSSEQYNLDMEQSRNQEMTRELESADLVDLLGGTKEDVNVEVKSIYYPDSILLRNICVRRMFRATITSNSKSNGVKGEVIRLLNLEKKARKWYGTVLPFAYFEHVLCPRIVSSVGENSVTMLSDILEKAMFNLSEQLGMVPKVFLDAQRDASRLGKPIRAVEETHVNNNDDDVELLEEPLSLILGMAHTSSIHHVEVIDLS